MKTTSPSESQHRSKLTRRGLLLGGAGAVAYGIYRVQSRGERVFLAGNQRYDGSLERTIADGLIAIGFDLRSFHGRTVLLKPNMVEPLRERPHVTTHHAVIMASAEVFRRAGARVVVGEGPGHLRDTELALLEAGVGEPLADSKLDFVDLNYDDIQEVANLGRVSPLKSFYLPRTVLEADLIVSLPKLKTHHWIGMTAAMKNLYGVLPGIKYGWPKNVLHHAGIPETVVDINASLPRTIAIVDAIECMEGDGPILGSTKHMGIIVIGGNLPAVDATCARLIGLEPTKIKYLRLAAGVLGPIVGNKIVQLGEPWQQLCSPFKLLDFSHLQELRSDVASS